MLVGRDQQIRHGGVAEQPLEDPDGPGRIVRGGERLGTGQQGLEAAAVLGSGGGGLGVMGGGGGRIAVGRGAAAVLHQQLEPFVGGGLDEPAAVDAVARAGPVEDLGEARQRQLVVAEGLGGPGEPVVVGRLVGVVGDPLLVVRRSIRLCLQKTRSRSFSAISR